MTLAVYRIDRATGVRTTVREEVTVTGSPAAVFARDTRFPACQCPRCRAVAPRSAWGAYLDHTCACAPCQTATSPQTQCETARALYRQARAEARR